MRPPLVAFAQTITIEKVHLADEGDTGASLVENQRVDRWATPPQSKGRQ
jgi:hypothetical protein